MANLAKKNSHIAAVKECSTFKDFKGNQTIEALDTINLHFTKTKIILSYKGCLSAMLSNYTF